MFSGFFYTLRKHEIDVSLTEWLTLLEALDKGLAQNSLSEFYYLSRALVVKTERDYDAFDAAFLDYFKDAHKLREAAGPGPETEGLGSRRVEAAASLDSPEDRADSAPLSAAFNDGALSGMAAMDLQGGMKMVGSETAKSAFDTAGSRRFRDFRDDSIINERQFQVVLRRLRQLSSHVDTPASELDIDATIHKTCAKGGILHVVMRKPRKNIVKLMLLIDSGGSMQAYSRFCTALFKAAMKSNSFQDLKIYYFHNCIYNKLYSDPTCGEEAALSSEWVLRNTGGEYKVIIVGDAGMAPFELSAANYYAGPHDTSLSGKEWMLLFKKKYRKIVWLNPEEEEYAWREPVTRRWLAAQFDMYLFTLKNFEIAMKKLLAG